LILLLRSFKEVQRAFPFFFSVFFAISSFLFLPFIHLLQINSSGDDQIVECAVRKEVSPRCLYRREIFLQLLYRRREVEKQRPQP